MPLFITQGRYSAEAYHGLVNAPDDRREAVSNLLEAGGAKLVDMYFTLGENDFFLISEAPSMGAVLSILMASAASGRVMDLKTVPAISTADAKAAMQKAGEIRHAYHPAGG